MQCSETTARSLLSELKFKFLRTRPGDYARKAALLTTMAHREEMLPILDFLESDNKFVVLYHYEANITVSVTQARAWMKSGASHDDPRKKSGAGQGRTAVFFSFSLLRYSVQVWVVCRLGAAMGILQWPEGSRRFDVGGPAQLQDGSRRNERWTLTRTVMRMKMRGRRRRVRAFWMLQRTPRTSLSRFSKSELLTPS